MLDVPQSIDDDCVHRVFQPAAHGLTGISLCLLHHEKSYICLQWKGFVWQAPLQLNATCIASISVASISEHLHNLCTTVARRSHDIRTQNLRTTFARPLHDLRTPFAQYSFSIHNFDTSTTCTMILPYRRMCTSTM